MKNEDLFFMYWDISTLFDDFLSCGRQDEIEQGDNRGVFPVMIIGMTGALSDKYYNMQQAARVSDILHGWYDGVWRYCALHARTSKAGVSEGESRTGYRRVCKDNMLDEINVDATAVLADCISRHHESTLFCLNLVSVFRKLERSDDHNHEYRRKNSGIYRQEGVKTWQTDRQKLLKW